jgi:hypothetical protein
MKILALVFLKEPEAAHGNRQITWHVLSGSVNRKTAPSLKIVYMPKKKVAQMFGYM